MALDALKTIVETSQGLSGWAIAIAGGSVAVILGSGYLRPKKLLVRLAYLLYLPGWFLLGSSVYYGQLIQRRYIAALLTDAGQAKGNLSEIAKCINSNFADQLDYFGWALVAFLCWLVIFLVWWIFDTSEKRKEGPTE